MNLSDNTVEGRRRVKNVKMVKIIGLFCKNIEQAVFLSGSPEKP